MKLRTILLGVLLAGQPLAASAAELAGSLCALPDDVVLEQRDQVRLAGLVSSRTSGLAQAMLSPDADERALVADLYDQGLYQPDELALGTYQCRTIKLGGMTMLVSYGWFSCEVGAEDSATVFRKATGSQQMFGLLFPTKAGLIYRGALKYGYEEHLTFYGDDPDRDQVGCLTQIGEDPGHYMLELPSPVYESAHDVLELRRAN